MSNKISLDIKDSIKNYVKYDDYIKEQEKKLRKLKKERDSFSNDIINFMIQGNNRNTDIKIGQSKIICQENKTMSSLNQNFIKSSIRNFFIEKY